jgi:hypothetical protein
MAKHNFSAIGILAAISLGFGIISPGIDNWAHVGGLMSGFIVGIALSPRYKVSIGTGIDAPKISNTKTLLQQLWIVPTISGVLVIGIFLGNLKVSNNPFHSVEHVENTYGNMDFQEILNDINSSIDSEKATSKTYYTRALIYIEMGDSQNAVGDLRTAIRIGRFNDRETMMDAISLLLLIRSNE